MNRVLRSWSTGLIVTILCLLFFTAAPAKADIHYTVSLEHPEQHLFHVTMDVPDVKDQLTLQMAAWNALYEIRDFSSHVQEVVAFANGQPVEIKKIDKLTWQVKGSGTITVRYTTFWDDVGPFSTQLNAEHALINPALILLYVPERRAEKCTLDLGKVPSDWKVASASLTSMLQSPRALGFQFTAPGYDALADAPIEASHFEDFTIHDLTPPVHVVIHGDNWRKREVENALRKICSYELRLMDGAPYTEYTFIFHVGNASGGGGGGMEHANSTAIFAPSDAFLNNVSAHEFFHLWNVKRIRPASLEPVDYTKEMYTRALWFAEGVDRDANTHAHVHGDAQQINMQQSAFERIDLPILHHRFLFAAGAQGDGENRVMAGLRAQDPRHLLGIHRQRKRVLLSSVQRGWHHAGGTGATSGAFAAPFPHLSFYDKRLHSGPRSSLQNL